MPRYSEPYALTIVEVVTAEQLGSSFGFTELEIRHAFGLDHCAWDAQPDNAIDLPALLAVLHHDLVAEEPCRARTGVGDQSLVRGQFELEVITQERRKTLFDLFRFGLRSGEPEQMVVGVADIPQPPEPRVMGVAFR